MTWPRSPEDAAKLASGAWITELRPVHLPGNKIAFRETIRPVTDFPEEPAPKVTLKRSGMSRKEAKRLGILK